MSLKNLMEKQQLDFNQPFLSVRRHNSTVATSESQGKRITDDSLPKKLPRLPFYKSDLKSGPITNPGKVPFVWEKTPGKPKDESKSKALAVDRVRPPIAPKLPPGRILNAERQPSDRYLENSMKSLCDSLNHEEAHSSSSGDSDEFYMDALDTLSRTESFFYNCSLSGVSGLEFDSPDIKPSGIFSADPQTRDLMMGRFLPAAKAMTLETLPQYATKKPLVISQEQRRPVQKIVNKQNSFSGPYHPLDKTWGENKDQYDDYESDGASVKTCGLFARMCMKSSICVLNPVPGIRMNARSLVSSVRRHKAKLDNEKHADTKPNGITDQSEVKMDLKNEIILHKGLLGNDDSLPFNNGDSQSVLGEWSSLESSKNRTDSVVNGHVPQREGRYSFGELLACDSLRYESASSSPVVEKTLYVDSVHKVKPQNLDSSSSGLIDYDEDNLEAPVKGGEMEKNPSVDFSVKNVDDLSFADAETKLERKTSESGNSSFRSSYGDRCFSELTYSDMSAGEKFDSDILQSTKCSDEESHHSNSQDSLALSSSKMIIDRKSLAPPLPKSPSESWLSRALPNVLSKNSRSFLGMSHCSINQASKASPLNPKWENLVKTSNVQHGHPRCSEECLTPIPEA
ncbi:hypothetical protein ACFE04_018413 [Oxalis oulophora]